MNNISCFCKADKVNINPVLNNSIKIVFEQKDIFYCGEQLQKNLCSYDTLSNIIKNSAQKYLLFINENTDISFTEDSISRMYNIAESTDAGMIYSDYILNDNSKLTAHPLSDFLIGSVRDDFNFGSLILFRTSALKEAAKHLDNNIRYSALYGAVLYLSEKSNIVRVPETLYTVKKKDYRKTGEKQHDYVKDEFRNIQKEMEDTFTAYLRHIGAYVAPELKKTDLRREDFEYEASVIIPVRNRAKTIGDALKSALSQQADFKYNVIVIDNHSNDGTEEIIRAYSQKHSNIVHIIPERNDLGIGGCWNEGINSPYCGKFAVQLDSDDIYSSKDTLSIIINKFYEESCGMVIGTYRMVNFRQEEIPPGIIDHKEWTADNGMNNALRINGLGAPRAFYTPLVREIQFPNVSYGEDYAVALAVCGEYKIGRIYSSLYDCRRWEGNSDADLDVNKTNSHNHYKDSIRSYEILKRIKRNSL